MWTFGVVKQVMEECHGAVILDLKQIRVVRGVAKVGLGLTRAVVSYANGEPARPWWEFTPQRKARESDGKL